LETWSFRLPYIFVNTFIQIYMCVCRYLDMHLGRDMYATIFFYIDYMYVYACSVLLTIIFEFFIFKWIRHDLTFGFWYIFVPQEKEQERRKEETPEG